MAEWQHSANHTNCGIEIGCYPQKSEPKNTCLVVLECQLVQAFLDDMVSVEVLDENHHMEAECDNDRVDLHIVTSISLKAAC
jgi:hypothetical protein